MRKANTRWKSIEKNSFVDFFRDDDSNLAKGKLNGGVLRFLFG